MAGRLSPEPPIDASLIYRVSEPQKRYPLLLETL